MKGLRDRCDAFIRDVALNGTPGTMLDSLVEFVVAETGRFAAGGPLDAALPLCLYFKTEIDREEFVSVVRLAKPGMRMKKL